jgi:hypothetical protein
MTASVQLKKIAGRESQGTCHQDKQIGGKPPLWSNSDSELSSLVRRWSAGNGVSLEVEESPLLEAITRKRLVETVTDWECEC